ncbi:hypothetical protein BAUCODRAFT_183003 [Baudoinia panamericana UAMH 10762]|uniref:Carbohydrate-binding module family 18 protein n=1 Tax=Baudoinia panamericana (strain UAMH 10762) TaxID=717646 RepID=M2MV06_BAUPA|nr:uncharacterized protein BAUCODRAFT_183003 [Baudoinia panamericana UAMH 10762]EMD00782.1 hypothetical protein BAUCODRAFT_183003 [Baudoinia panamericana UAMH 10762]
MRLASIIIGTLATLATAAPTLTSPANDSPMDMLATLMERDIIQCPCYPNCGCRTGSYCFCNGASQYGPNAAPCTSSATCGCSGTGYWGQCDVSV